MKKMQQVQPQLKELREKYKDNPQLLNTKMMELYRTEGVNPFGGCLPILLQIPVFFALYATLDGAVELRQVAFWWCKDLAAADTVAKIPLYFFDLPINPLVLAMTLLMAIQQRMTPMSGDPMQKKMMMMMPGIMLIFLYDLPSGLTLYWTVSNLFSIVQLMLQQRAGKKAAATAK
jgi:YidC/Oxa1 family membrane protein insertase